MSASDLSQFLGCRHRTALDLAVAHGQRAAPTWVDPAMLVLQQRGLDHERSYADSLRAEGLTVIALADHAGDEAVDRSLDAMRAGTNVILQPALRNGSWFGRPDVLRRVETPSGFGAWSYEVVDTKLAKDTRGGTVLQLALYSELLGVVQDAVPEMFHVVTPDHERPVQSFRVQDFTAYFRFIRTRLELTVQQEPGALAAANYPEPVEHCDVCRWWSVCDKRRRAAATSILRGTTLLGARTEACMSYMKRERSAGDKVIEDIAKQHLGLSTLETRRSDSLDFHDLAVWQLRAALEAAYRAG
jgi:uncharacterized protein